MIENYYYMKKGHWVDSQCPFFFQSITFSQNILRKYKNAAQTRNFAQFFDGLFQNYSYL